MSMVTTSAELDPTLSDNAAIATQIWELVASLGNGNPLDPTSFGEEDVIELCIGLGQEHSKGVLRILDTKMVVAFSSSPNMMAASQHFAVATICCNEPVQFHIQLLHNYTDKGVHCCHRQLPLWCSDNSPG